MGFGETGSKRWGQSSLPAGWLLGTVPEILTVVCNNMNVLAVTNGTLKMVQTELWGCSAGRMFV